MHSLVLSLLSFLLVHGRVTDATSGAPLAGVTVQVVGSTTAAVTDSAGRFTLDAAPGARLRFVVAGYAPLVSVAPATETAELRIALTRSSQALEGVVVRALRAEGAAGSAPISQKLVGREELQRSYFGQDMPHQLAFTPSMTAYADAGSYGGYSYMRLRGIDQTRINITVDGIPLNESEDQGFYFQNIADFGNSMESVQIQRGVGTSSNGTASYAGSVNFQSLSLAGTRRGGDVELTRGSFDTNRASAAYHTGLLSNGLAFYGRVSGSGTDGYRRHSSNESSSFFASGGYFGEKNIAKVTAFGGVARNQLAYSAAPIDEIERDPRANPLTPDERDRFWQQVASLAYTRVLSPSASLTTTAYAQQAGGAYGVLIDSALDDFALASTWTGVLTNLSVRPAGAAFDIGAHVSSYRRDHSAYPHTDPAARLYSNRGRKNEASGFVKGSYDVGVVTLFGDVQLRHARFEYTPDRNASVSLAPIDWTFLNPKAGVLYRAAPSLTFYASYGSNGREPTRNDMFAGFDDVDTSNVALIAPLDRVKPERVRDFEAGTSYRTGAFAVEANVFDMRFHNEIAAIGPLSYLGLPLRKNVRTSYRQGIEVDASYQVTPALALLANASLTHSRIREYTDDATGETFHDVEPLLTPRVLGSQSVRYEAGRWGSLALTGRYVGRSYLSNTGNDAFVTPPWYALDASLTLRAGRQSILIQGNNLADRRIFTGGYTDGATSYYYVMPGRNLFVTAKVEF